MIMPHATSHVIAREGCSLHVDVTTAPMGCHEICARSLYCTTDSWHRRSSVDEAVIGPQISVSRTVAGYRLARVTLG
jgi:hypothetical protein